MSSIIRNPTTTVYKFSIKRYLDEMASSSAKRARRELAQKLGISYGRFVIISNLEEDSSSTINSDQVQAIADYFGVTPNDILLPYEEPE